MRLLALGVAAVVGLALSASSRSAHAQPVDPTPAAEDLFQRAKAFVAKKDLASACPLFAESYRLDPAGGTLQNLAVCYEESGKWASASARFQELRSLSKNASPPRPDRVKLADEQLVIVAPRVAHVVIVLADAAPLPVEVALDGVTYERPSWSSGIAVDPGEHRIVVTAPGKRAFETSVTVSRDGSEERVRVPVLEDAPAASAPGPSSPLPDHDDAALAREASARRRRTAGLVVGGVGVAALGAGVVFGVLNVTKNAAGRDKCMRSGNPSAPASDFDPASGQCYRGSSAWHDANATKDDARTFANVADVLLPVGIVGLAVGAYLVLSRGGSTRGGSALASASPAVRVAPSLGGAIVEGSF